MPQIICLLDHIANNKEAGIHGAIYTDGSRSAVICDAVLESPDSKKQVDVKY